MSKHFLSGLILAVIATSALACGEVTGSFSEHGSGATSSNSATNAVASGAGSSFSMATNTQTAASTYSDYAGGSHSGKKDDAYLGAGANVQGTTTVTGSSLAYNVSSGNASGSASAGGAGHAAADSAGAFQGRNAYGKLSGEVSGRSNAVISDGVVAGTNQGGFVGGTSTSGFDQRADADLEGQGICGKGNARCGTYGVQQNVTTLSNTYATNTQFSGLVMNGATPLNAAVTNVNVDGSAKGSASAKTWTPKN